MLKFKNTKLRAEFYDLAQTDPRLRAVAAELGFWTKRLLGKEVIITCVWRTRGEQEELYGRSKPSAHFCSPQCRAVDIRAHEGYFTLPELENLTFFIEKYFPRQDGFKPVLLHGEGDEFHIHLSVEPLPETN